MNQKLIFIAFLIFSAVMYYGCKEDSIQSTNDEQVAQFSGQLTNHSDCKGSQITTASADTGDSSSCMEYLFDPVGHKLIMRHINAGFNCCPDSLFCLISLRNDTIFVEEHEKIPGCHCDCLFDLDIEIAGILPKMYHVRIIEPYCGDQEKLYFDIDLSAMQQGSFCVRRTGYPWGGGKL